MLEQVLEGLVAIHDAGWVHLDLKADNILASSTTDAGANITSSEFVGGLHISDFGLARKVGAPLDQGHGTKTHLPPELAATGGGRAAPEMDVWSFGVVCMEIIQARASIRSPALAAHVACASGQEHVVSARAMWCAQSKGMMA